LASIINSEIVKMGYKGKVINIALPDDFLIAGTYKYMLEKYGLTADVIAERILDVGI
jgi:transketolase C-terminal domain/subunit